MIRRRPVALAGLAACAAGGAGQTLRLFADDSYAPLSYLSRGSASGLLVDLLQQAQQLSGDRYQLELLPWARAIALAMRGQGGVIGVSYTAERSLWLDYSAPVYHDDVRILARRDRGLRFESVADLRGRTLGGAQAASYGEAVDRLLRSGMVSMVRDWGVDRRIRMLLAGRSDGALIGSGSAGLAALFALHPELQARRAELVLLPRPLARDPLYLAFPKSLAQQAAIQRFDQALRRLRPERRRV